MLKTLSSWRPADPRERFVNPRSVTLFPSDFDPRARSDDPSPERRHGCAGPAHTPRRRAHDQSRQELACRLGALHRRHCRDALWRRAARLPVRSAAPRSRSLPAFEGPCGRGRLRRACGDGFLRSSASRATLSKRLGLLGPCLAQGRARRGAFNRRAGTWAECRHRHGAGGKTRGRELARLRPARRRRMQEGEVWEAAMCAAHHKLDNLCAIVDYNKLQSDAKSHHTGSSRSRTNGAPSAGRSRSRATIMRSFSPPLRARPSTQGRPSCRDRPYDKGQGRLLSWKTRSPGTIGRRSARISTPAIAELEAAHA